MENALSANYLAASSGLKAQPEEYGGNRDLGIPPQEFGSLAAADLRSRGLCTAAVRGPGRAQRPRHLLAHRHRTLDHCAPRGAALRCVLVFDAGRAVCTSGVARRTRDCMALRPIRLGGTG